ncbi:MAG: ATP-dependent RecD-like DNA helicase [Andreesenia angusta]|nr:ATP-dependent RecD-like DNA helicase [Andreesenia angusta]
MQFDGMIESILFKNEENGYTVARLKTEDGIITVVGNMPIVSEGESVSIEGDIVYHKTYGEQIKVNSYKLIVPENEDGIIKYLSSGIIKGIGKKTAERIVEYFGKESIDIIKYAPNKLEEIPGIGRKTIDKIISSFKDEAMLREIIIYFQNFNISPKLCMKIYKEYGEEAINILNENPYKLAEEVRGIGFLKADEIALNMGVDLNSIYRVTAGILFILRKESLNGHSFLPLDELITKTSEILEVDNKAIENGIEQLSVDNKIHIELDGDSKLVYNSLYYNSEAGVAKKLVRLAISDKHYLESDIEKKIEEIEIENNFKFAEKQKAAIKEATKAGVLIITGGPGTGKTTTINTIIKVFESEGHQVLLTAPTGRAAKRMTEATEKEAKTIHRLLEYSYVDEFGGMYFVRNREYLLEADLIIVDEVSMVDIVLMNSLLDAIGPETRLILVGDVDQLPSVGAGNVLKDIIGSGIVNTVELDEVFRQAQESMIVMNAHKINKGEFPILNAKEKDFFFLKEKDQEKISEIILDLVKKRLPIFNQYDSFTDIQVLASTRIGLAGVNNLNNILQEGLNPFKGGSFEKRIGNTIFRIGDKVMQIRNNYNILWKRFEDGAILEKGKGVFNGDIGFVSDINDDDMELTVLFDDGKEVIYKYQELDQIVLSYATTIHKSQGSEFPVVIIPITSGPPMLLTRNLLYTGITRAKELVVLVGNPYYLKYMIDNNDVSERYSALDRRLSTIKEFSKE